MTTGNLAVMNFTGGELSPLIYGRNDLDLQKRGLEWQRNMYSLEQGGSRYRNGWFNVHNTKDHGLARLIPFEFNNEDTYALVMHDQFMRVIRDDGPVVETAKNISAATKANPCQLTITGHGYSAGDEIFIDGVVGMEELNDQFFKVRSVVDANNITLEDTLGDDIDSTDFTTYSSGGTAARIFEIATPFEYDHLEELHYTQNSDTILTARHRYPPFFITRLDHDDWHITTGQLSSPVNITGITKALSGVFTTRDEHGFQVGDQVWVGSIVGMTQYNNGHFVVETTPTNTTLTLKDTAGNSVDSTGFTTYSSGGVIFKIAHRTNDPFGQRVISGITKANPGVFTTTTDHELKINDEVFFADINGMTELNNTRYFVKTVPSTTTFTVAEEEGGTELNTSSLTAWLSGGTVTPLKKVPKTLTTIQEARLGYANTPSEPDLFIFSRSPDASTGEQRYQDFELNTDDTYAVKGNLAAIFGSLEAITWLATVGDELIVGTTGSIRRLIGKDGNGFLTPSNAKAPAINNIGSAPHQPISNGRTLYYIENNIRTLRNFIFDFAVDGYNTIDVNLVTDHLVQPGIKQIDEQLGRPDTIWALRADGVLAGMTFKESENIYAWHRHEVSGSSRDDDDRLQPWAKILSIAVLKRSNNYTRLWAIIEREITIDGATKTTRSIEYMTDKVHYEVLHNFFRGEGEDARQAAVTKWLNSRMEAVKDDIYVDSCVRYDGRLIGGSLTLTPAATTGATVNFTASGAFFDSSMIGRRLVKTYSRWGDGGGVAVIKSITTSTVAVCEILDDFDTTDAIPAGQWIITTDTVKGLRIFRGQSVRVQVDGADGGTYTVGLDGTLSLSKQAGVINIGLPYAGLWVSTNMEVVPIKGSSQAKIRRIIRTQARLFASGGLKVGSTPWNVKPVVLRQNEDLTDQLNPLMDGIVDCEISDEHARQSKQVCVVKDDPTPLVLLSVDSEVEVINA